MSDALGPAPSSARKTHRWSRTIPPVFRSDFRRLLARARAIGLCFWIGRKFKRRMDYESWRNLTARSELPTSFAPAAGSCELKYIPSDRGGPLPVCAFSLGQMGECHKTARSAERALTRRLLGACRFIIMSCGFGRAVSKRKLRFRESAAWRRARALLSLRDFHQCEAAVPTL